MNVLLSRWQFGVTITYHFLFVPLTIGLGMFVAVMQVLAYRRRDPGWDRLARFFGTLFLINFAMGVVTGAFFVLGVSAWQRLRGHQPEVFSRAAKLAAGVAVVCTLLVIVTGDIQARLMDTQQPMKMASAEAVYRTQQGASFSLLTI